mgnify:FL=1
MFFIIVAINIKQTIVGQYNLSIKTNLSDIYYRPWAADNK